MQINIVCFCRADMHIEILSLNIYQHRINSEKNADCVFHQPSIVKKKKKTLQIKAKFNKLTQNRAKNGGYNVVKALLLCATTTADLAQYDGFLVKHTIPC